MKEVTIKYYTLSDLKEWIWRKLFLPKRKEVEEWITEFHDVIIFEDCADLIGELVGSHIFSDAQMRSIIELENRIKNAIKKQEQETIKLIYKQ